MIIFSFLEAHFESMASMLLGVTWRMLLFLGPLAEEGLSASTILRVTWDKVEGCQLAKIVDAILLHRDDLKHREYEQLNPLPARKQIGRAETRRPWDRWDRGRTASPSHRDGRTPWGR